MPSTYTTNLGIEKIATGEQSGTWGTTTNTNLDLIDEAVNGIVSITLSSAGSSGSPNSLPVTDGSSSNGRNKFIEFVDGGDLGATAYVQLTPNNAEKIVHVRNSLSGSRAIIVFQGTYNASNDFQIENGKDVVLKFDGAGTNATVKDVFTDLAVTKVDATTLAIGGTAVTSTAAEINKLDGFTGTVDDLDYAKDLRATGVTTTEFDKLDGLTATTTELNYVDVTTLGTVEASKAVTANSSGEVIVPDNKRILFGSGSDVGIQYDETTDDRLEISGGEVFVDNTLTAKRGIGTTLTDTSNTGSVTLDFSASQNFVLTLTGNVTLANPSTEAVGQSGFIVLIQDGTGGRTVSLGTDYETAAGAGLTLSSTASTTDIVPYIVAASGRILLGAPQLAFA
jgi:hypothetical protein|tara:strand:+ start:2005 stop:3189 length:1185 start_codon:yes stop_codon:yes gene_type:complete